MAKKSSTKPRKPAPDAPLEPTDFAVSKPAHVLGQPVPAHVFPDPAAVAKTLGMDLPPVPPQPLLTVGPPQMRAEARFAMPTRVLPPTFGGVSQASQQARQRADALRAMLASAMKQMDAVDLEATRLESWISTTPDGEALITAEQIDMQQVRQFASMCRHILNTFAPANG